MLLEDVNRLGGAKTALPNSTCCSAAKSAAVIVPGNGAESDEDPNQLDKVPDVPLACWVNVLVALIVPPGLLLSENM